MILKNVHLSFYDVSVSDELLFIKTETLCNV